MEPITLESVLLAYGPLGVMVIGLAMVVLRLWKELNTCRNTLMRVLQEQIEHEATMRVEHNKLIMQIDRSLEILAERLANVKQDTG